MAKVNIDNGKVDIGRLMEIPEFRCNRQVMVSLLRSLNYITLTDKEQRASELPPVSDRVEKCGQWKKIRGQAESNVYEQRRRIRPSMDLGNLEEERSNAATMETLYCTDEMQTADSCDYWQEALERYDRWTAGMATQLYIQGQPKDAINFYDESGDALLARARQTCGDPGIGRQSRQSGQSPAGNPAFVK